MTYDIWTRGTDALALDQGIELQSDATFESIRGASAQAAVALNALPMSRHDQRPDRIGTEAEVKAAHLGAAPAAPDTLAARIAALELSVIEHPSLSEGLQALDESLGRARITLDGKKLKAKARLIYGLTGAGKTTLIEAFTGRHPTVSTPDGDIRRVVTVEMPRPSTQRSLVSAIMGGLGYRPRLRDNADQIIGSIVSLVQRLGVELIIIDEGHHMIAGTGMVDVTEFLKSLLNRIGCEIAILGLPALESISASGQLNRRLHPDLLLDPYDWTSIEGRIEFLGLMAEFEELLGLPEPSELVDEDFAMRIYVATGGSIGIVSKYLSRGLELAAHRGLPRIDRELLAEVYASWHPKSKVKTKIDFAASLADVAPEVTLEDLVEARRRESIDAENNPFLCSVERCGELWERRMVGEPDIVEPNKRKLKSSGPQPRRRGRREPEGFRA